MIPLETVAVVICTHSEDRLDHLAEAVASVKAQSVEVLEVAVVVDGPAHLFELVARRLPDVMLVPLGERRGLAAARNAGVAAVTADLVAFLDDDAVASPAWLEHLIDAVAAPEVLGASSASVPVWQAAKPRWLPEEFYWTVGCSFRGQPRTRTRVRNVYGGCCLLRRELFDELGGYDVNLGRSGTSAGGGEEAELCVRASRKWPEAVFFHTPAAQIRHRVPPDRLTYRYLLRRAFDEGRMKARVSQLAPVSLGPERRFAMALPRAVVQESRRALHRDRDAAARVGGLVALSGAVVAGLGIEMLRRGVP